MKNRDRLKKSERRRQTLLELKLRPHVRISELAKRFNVSTETVRRDFDALADDGLISRAHGGASVPVQGHYPGLDERAHARIKERERIGWRAANLIQSGETLMIDSGSTTIQMARALGWIGTQCTVITNSIPVAMTLGHSSIDVIMCPGDYLPEESAVVGTETLEFLARFNVERCIIGASSLSVEGLSENVRGFAAIKRAMLRRAQKRNLVIDSQKFGLQGLAHVGELADLHCIVTDSSPRGALLEAMNGAGVDILLAKDSLAYS